MVAAAKLRRAQMRITQLRPYAEALSGMLADVAAMVDHSLNPFLQERRVQNVCYVVLTADRGLCGSFNSNILRYAKNAIDANVEAGYKVSLVAAGKKGFEFFDKRGYSIFHRRINFFNNLAFEHALELSQVVQRGFLKGDFDRVLLVYMRAKSPVKQEVQLEQLLPIVPQTDETLTSRADYIFEPAPEKILGALCPKSINIRLWQALAESYYAEEGARMIAMDNATENAQEMIERLTLHYNKVRQATITKEISEIVAGAEALK